VIQDAQADMRVVLACRRGDRFGKVRDREPEVTFGQQRTKQRAFVDVTPKYRVHEIPGDEDAASVLSVCVACLVAPWRSICCCSRILHLQRLQIAFTQLESDGK
jgi:hypothetical protein